MNCPACKSAMITMELAEVEIDYCTGCKGVWLDAGELEIMLDDEGRAQKLISSFNKDTSSSEESKQCPICDKKMEKIVVGNEKPTLVIDRCAKGDGLWLDAQELNEIIGKAKLHEGNKIVQLLADMFGKNS